MTVCDDYKQVQGSRYNARFIFIRKLRSAKVTSHVRSAGEQCIYNKLMADQHFVIYLIVIQIKGDVTYRGHSAILRKKGHRSIRRLISHMLKCI